MDTRGLIINWIKANGLDRHWLLGVYHYLLSHGASSDDAIKAMDDFVDEAITFKKNKANERTPVGD